VHFSDGVVVGPRPTEATSPYPPAQPVQATSFPVQPDIGATPQSGAPRSPPKLTSPRLRSASVSNTPHAGVANPAEVAPPMRNVPTTAVETPPLPENFVEDGDSGQHPVPETTTNKQQSTPTLPPEVIAAATSLSAQVDVAHPQWTNNDISEEDIKAKIEAISREIAQELEQKRMETEAQAKERKRAEAPPPTRRRSTNEAVFSGGEENEPGASSIPRGRGRPKGSGRTRSSLSSSSSTSFAGTNTPSQHDISDSSVIPPRGPDFQATRTSVRTANRVGTMPVTVRP
ncbi:unnamed protein product, partial [Cylicostephanus goldi]